MRTAHLLVLALATAPSVLAAQPAVTAGASVRVVAAPGSRPTLSGRLARLDHDTVWIAGEGAGAPAAVVLGSGDRLEVSGGRHSETTLGMALGAAGGAVVGAIVGWSRYHAPTCAETLCFDFGGPATATLAGAVVGAGAGTLAGALLGHFIVREHWRAVDRERVHFALGPAPDAGIAVGVALPL